MLLAAGAWIFLAWLVIGAALVGIGTLALRTLDSSLELTDAFWLGLCVSVAVLQIWSLLFALTWAAPVLLGCLGFAGLVLSRSRIGASLRLSWRESRFKLAAALAIVFFLAVRAVAPCDYYDTGLYGAPAIRWAMIYPVVPGLANLNLRFGINSSIFVFMAALNHGIWNGLVYHLFAGLLLAAASLTILPSCYRLIRDEAMRPADWFHSIVAIMLVYWVARATLVGTLTDEPAAVVCLVAVGMILRGTRQFNESCSPPATVVAVALLALAVSFKLSTAIFVAVAASFALVEIWRAQESPRERIRRAAVAVALAAAVLIPWCLRGIILSGYPFYPSTFLGIPADWKQPAGLAKWCTAAVRSYARNPAAYFLSESQGWGWLPSWFHQILHNRISFQVPGAISFIGVVLLALAKWQKRPVASGSWLGLIAASVVAIVFCFWAAPEPRFAEFAIWTAAGTMGAWGIVSEVSMSRKSVAVISAALVVMMMWCLVSTGWRPLYHNLVSTAPLARLPQAALITRQTLSGLVVYIPTESNQCWEALLPCTPYFDETLRLRDPHSLRHGFASGASDDYIRRFWAAPIR